MDIAQFAPSWVVSEYAIRGEKEDIASTVRADVGNAETPGLAGARIRAEWRSWIGLPITARALPPHA